MRLEREYLLLAFTLAYELRIVNTYLKKREEYYRTYKRLGKYWELIFFLRMRGCIIQYKDCKVIPDGSVTTKHSLLVMVICYRKYVVYKRKINIRNRELGGEN